MIEEVKMNRIHTTILAAPIALFLACGLAAAQVPQTDNPGDAGAQDGNGRRMEHRGPRGRMGPEQMVRMITHRLELDETQTEQLNNIAAGAKPEFDALRDKRVANREATRNLDVDDPDYGVKSQNLAAASGEIAASTAELMSRIRSDIHAILTPEQREQLATAAENGRHHGPGHRRREGSKSDPQ